MSVKRLIELVKSHLSALPPHVLQRRTAFLLADTVRELERLSKGDLTAEEFHDLCHNHPLMGQDRVSVDSLYSPSNTKRYAPGG